MKIETHIKKHFLRKLGNSPCLTIYDSEKLYKEIVLSLQNEDIQVIDSSSNPIVAHENAVIEWLRLAESTNRQMIIYLPYEQPLSENEKIRDPFYVFAISGAIFPYDAADRYIEICRMAFPSQKEKIEKLFAQQIPSFSTVNAIEGGANYPVLRTLSGGTSSKEIVIALLLPTAAQKNKFQTDNSWWTEIQSLTEEYLGLKTSVKDYQLLRTELWRYLLFSEFVFDLPAQLPAELKNVNRATPQFRETIYAICEQLRNLRNSKQTYIDNARQVAKDYSLEKYFGNESDLGDIVTFAFEDNTYFNQFVELIEKQQFDTAQKRLEKHLQSIWVDHDTERHNVWEIGKYGMEICQFINQNNVEYSKTEKLQQLIDLYSTTLWQIDRKQRYFEKSFNNLQTPSTSVITNFAAYIRQLYLEFIDKVQKKFIGLISKEGWKTSDSLRNIDIFDRYIQSVFNSKNRIAYIMVDALRFELGKEIEQSLEKKYSVQLRPSRAYLPTVTKFGMAALLPNAAQKLSLKAKDKELLPFFADELVATPADRGKIFQKEYGTRTEMCEMTEFLGKSTISETIELLVLYHTDIDYSGETLGVAGLDAIHSGIQKILKTIQTLDRYGFSTVYIVTDHGFILLPQHTSGSTLKIPDGNWCMQKSRSLAGKGNISEALISFPPEQLDIRSDVNAFVFHRTLGVFRSGTTYFHEGISLTETIVPFIEINLKKSKKETNEKFDITLTYKGKQSGTITTRMPLIEVSAYSEIMFLEKEIRIEARNKNEIVGQIKSGENVNPTTSTVNIKSQQALKVGLYMNTDFEGTFTVEASDSITGLTYQTIELSTDYM